MQQRYVIDPSVERTVISSWVPPEMKAVLTSHARAAERSLSAEVRKVLREHLAQSNQSNSP